MTTPTGRPRRSDGRRGFVKVAEEPSEPFFPASVNVVLSRKKNTTWHIVACRVTQSRAGRSGVHVTEEVRVASAPSSVQATKAVQYLAESSHAMSVLPPDPDRSLFAALCPVHGVVRHNSTADYAIESAYWHAIEHES